MKNRMAIDIIRDISKEHTNPAEQRAFDKAVAALEYCEKQGLTYYIEEKCYEEMDIN